MRRRIRWFLRLAALASRGAPLAHELRRLRTRLHLRLRGDGGGDYGLVLSHGRLRVSEGPLAGATSTVTLPAALFVELLAGRGHFVTAQLTGAIWVEGEGHGGLVVGALFAGLEAATRGGGLRGVAARAFVRWLGRTGENR